MPEIGRSGQEKLKKARLLLLGAGGLGSPALLYLAAAGVGYIRIVDADSLDLTNLQRQVLYGTAGIGQKKATLAAAALSELNPEIQLDPRPLVFEPASALDLMADVDLVVEGFDTFSAKFLANDAAVLCGRPLISGGILRFRGQVQGIRPGQSACMRCLFYEPPAASVVPSCAQAGVLGAMAGWTGSLMAAEALKFLTGVGESIMGKLVQLELLSSSFRSIVLNRRLDCAVCGQDPSIQKLDAERYIEPAFVLGA